MISSKYPFFAVSLCMVAVTKFMDFMWSYITHCLQNAESSTFFEDFVVQGQWQGFLNMVVEDKDFLQYNNTVYSVKSLGKPRAMCLYDWPFCDGPKCRLRFGDRNADSNSGRIGALWTGVDRMQVGGCRTGSYVTRFWRHNPTNVHRTCATTSNHVGPTNLHTGPTA